MVKNASPHPGNSNSTTKGVVVVGSSTNPVHANTDAVPHDGIAGIVDVEKFSSIGTSHDQIALVNALWNNTFRSELIKTVPRAHLNSTGDGLLVAVPLNKTNFINMLSWASGLIHDNAISKFEKKLRVGLHCGRYSILPHQSSSVSRDAQHTIAVGTTLNHCSRVCAVGDGDHIIVSEAFASNYADLFGWGDANRLFVPHGPDKFYEVSSKHGTHVQFRMYRDGGRDPSVPMRLRLVQVAKQHILDALRRIESTFRLAVGNHYRTVGRDLKDRACKLDIRVCIFLPDESGERLISNEYRHHPNAKHLRASNAEYFITGNGTGVCGIAFASRELQVLHNLPDRKTHMQQYDTYHTTLGVRPENLNSWQRHPQSIVAFPFALMSYDDARPPLGVVCIDVIDDKLEWLPESDLKDIGKEVQSYYGTLLGSLLLLQN